MQPPKTSVTPKRNAVLAIVAVLSVIICAPTPRAAAACSPSVTYGQVSLSVSVASAATYRVWTRVMPADATNNSYALEIDNGSCISVGNSAALSPDAWAWVDYQGGSTDNKIDVSLSAGTHTVKLIGTEPGVTVDRLFFTADSTSAPASADVTPDGAPITTSTQSKGNVTTSSSDVVGPKSAETPNADGSSAPKRTIGTTSSPKTVAGTEVPLSPVAATAALSALVILAFGFLMLRTHIRRRAWHARHLVGDQRSAVSGAPAPVAQQVPYMAPEPQQTTERERAVAAPSVAPVAPGPLTEPAAVPSDAQPTTYQPANPGAVIIAGSVTPATAQPAPGATIMPNDPHELDF